MLPCLFRLTPTTVSFLRQRIYIYILYRRHIYMVFCADDDKQLRGRGAIVVLFCLLLLFVRTATLVSAEHSRYRYCEGRWVDFSSMESPFMNYTMHGARTTFDYENPKQSILDFVRDACPAQEARYSCYMRADDVRRSRKQEEIHFVPFDRKTCAPFTPSSFLERIRDRRVVVMGDSVAGQLWYSLVCSLYKMEENHLYTYTVDIDLQCKRKSNKCPIAPNPYKNKPNPQAAHLQSGFLRFRDSNSSVAHVHRNLIEPPSFAADFARQRLTPNDIVLVHLGLHHADVEEDYRKEFVWLAKWMNEQTSLPMFLILHTSPQHFNTTNGYHVPFETTGDNNSPHCSPLRELNESTAATHWRSKALEEIFEPLVKQKKVFIVPITMGLNERHNAHMGWGDCTHWCFPGNVFKYMHLMIHNALRRVLPYDKTKKLKRSPVDKTDMSYKLHPALRNGALVQFKKERSIYYAQNGTLREFQSWDAFVTHGFDTSNVVALERFEQGPVSEGEPIAVESKLN